jgi:hypothetical protein
MLFLSNGYIGVFEFDFDVFNCLPLCSLIRVQLYIHSECFTSYICRYSVAPDIRIARYMYLVMLRIMLNSIDHLHIYFEYVDLNTDPSRGFLGHFMLLGPFHFITPSASENSI